MTTRRPVLLVVDDKRNMLSLMSKVLKADGRVLTADNGSEALRLLATEPVDVILCDLRMPDMDGLDVLRASKRLRPASEFVLMTAFASVGTAVEALKLGAYDYLTKPMEPDVARSVLLRALHRVEVTTEELPSAEASVLPGVIARSESMTKVAELVRRLADGEITTLIMGETGTGKERIARALHELSPRAQKRFVSLNCAALPPDLLESELFGHVRGAFTGATSTRRGLFEEADGGSLFLDEIGDMLPSLQAKLTRVLEERTVRRVGDTDERPIDVRLIAATHRDLPQMVEAETFRKDLWYRLNVALVELPPLRTRREDIELLAQHFLRAQAERARGKTPHSFSHAAVEALVAYDWPGNVRQLRSAVERASVVATGDEIQVADLPHELLRSEFASGGDPVLAAGTWAQACEIGRLQTGKRYLEAVLRKFDGQVADAAQHADVERESFYRLLKKHGIDPLDFRGRQVKASGPK